MTTERVAATTLYTHPGISDALLARFSKARTTATIAHTRGLTSLVYRLDDGQAGRAYCIKRVVEEDEVRPHSVRREMLCYRLINELAGTPPPPIISLLAAFRDESDPFSVVVDLVMPFHPCTLQDLMDEPLMQMWEAKASERAGAAVTALHRPALPLLERILARPHGFEAFVRESSRELFSALAFLHTAHLAHRDVKPSNILVDETSLSILLIDFGTCHLPAYAPGDDGLGGVASEVGTGAYRAPESLFSPLHGYPFDRLDMWQAGATLVQFVLPLRPVAIRAVRASSEGAGTHEPLEGDDDRQEWERALWADDAGLSWSKLEEAWQSDVSEAVLHGSGAEGSDDDDDEGEESASGWKRETLFDAARGDLGLANSIFALRGLPDSTDEWPEAQHFQPSLARMPFPRRRPAPGGLLSRLPASPPASLAPLLGVLDQCLQLSASKRITADQALAQL